MEAEGEQGEMAATGRSSGSNTGGGSGIPRARMQNQPRTTPNKRRTQPSSAEVSCFAHLHRQIYQMQCSHALHSQSCGHSIACASM